MQKFMKSFVADESGATAIEYGLIAALIAVGIIAAGGLLGNTLSDQFNNIANEVETAGAGNFSGTP